MVTARTLGEIAKGRPLLTVGAEESVLEAARRMVRTDKGAVLVMQGERLAGIFTERDLLRRVLALGRDPRDLPISEVMTRDVVVGHTEESYGEGLRKMVQANCRHLPVVEGERLVGVVSRRELMTHDIDVIETLLEQAEPARLFI